MRPACTCRRRRDDHHTRCRNAQSAKPCTAAADLEPLPPRMRNAPLLQHARRHDTFLGLHAEPGIDSLLTTATVTTQLVRRR